MQSVFQEWREDLASIRKERLVQEMKEEYLKMKMQDDDLRKRALGMLFGGQAGFVKRKAFTGRKDELQQLWVDNCIQKLKEENLWFKAKGDESMRRAMRIVFGGQALMLAKQFLTGWKDELQQLRVDNYIQKLKEENLRFKAKGDESMRRAMRMVFGGQALLLAKQFLTGWQDILG